jgi:hypothetical protein
MEQLSETTKQEITKLIEIALKPISGKVISFQSEVPMAQVVTPGSSYQDQEGEFFRVEIASDEDIQVLYLTIKPNTKPWEIVLDSLEKGVFPYHHVSTELKEKIKDVVSKINKGDLFIFERGPFVAISPLGTVVSNVRVLVNQNERMVRFGISGPDMSIKQWDTHSPKLIELAEDALTGGVIDAFEFEGVYYFTFTGSHFQQEEEIPLWASVEIHNLK